MPSSAGMRPTTRVFGMVKSYDGARVLRSGRRLWPDLSIDETNKLFETIKKKKKKNDKENEKNHKTSNNNAKRTRPSRRKPAKHKVRKDEPKNTTVVDNKFGMVYTRKRKRIMVGFDGGVKSIISLSSARGEICDRWLSVRDESFAAVDISKGFCGFSLFLYTILKYMSTTSLGLDELAGFLLSQPISDAYSSLGLRFSWDPCSRTGLCKFFGARQFVPLFSMDFSAVPRCFMYMHQFTLLRLVFQQYALVNKLMTNEIMAESEEEDNENEMSDSSVWAPSAGIILGLAAAPKVDHSRDRVLTRSQIKASKLATRSSLLDSQTNQKTTSLISRGPKSSAVFVTDKAKDASVSNSVSSNRNIIPLPSVNPNYKLRSSIQRSSASNLASLTPKNQNHKLRSSIQRSSASKLESSTPNNHKLRSSTQRSSALNLESLTPNNQKLQTSIQRSSALKLKSLTPNIDASNCSANILYIEPDKCYREEGASVILETSSSGERFLVIKKNGVTKYTYKPLNNMRLPACNRFTHALMWMVDNSWKLEFPNRHDWQIFKDLYKECAEHNLPESFFRVIPVPWVCEVSGFDAVNTVPFHRPDSYITTCGDELSRALAKTTANYDVDSEDEEWLEKFDNDSLTVDHFELMVDSFEKDFYFSAEDFNNEKVAPNVGSDFGRREIVEAVYGYWKRKRKQRQSALLKVFQRYERPSLYPKQPPRRKRSFKRQASQPGRTKLPSFLLEAILKRQRAEALLENADLATYNAKMLPRIAEAAQILGSMDADVSHFLY
ncbi:hypothetical protein ACFE04_009127 [Oxalis oulophora]